MPRALANTVFTTNGLTTLPSGGAFKRKPACPSCCLPPACVLGCSLGRRGILGAFQLCICSRSHRSSGRRTVSVLVWYCNYTNFLHRNDGASSFGRCGRPESYLHCITYLVSYFVLHTGLVSSFGGCMAQASYFDTARRPVSFLAKKARFVTTSNLRSCHKAIQSVGGRSGRVHEYACDCSR
mgnify:CR=1 FL=1